MRIRSDIFHPDFKAQPWWWEAWTPNNSLSQDPPTKTDVVIVGAGYGGLSTALELRRNGIGAVVLERGVFGIGASTRNSPRNSSAPASGICAQRNSIRAGLPTSSGCASANSPSSRNET